MRGKLRLKTTVLVLALLPIACAGAADLPLPGFSSAARWDHRPEASAWTEATVRALKADGAVLVSTVPEDVGAFCPAYATAAPDQRRAFWVGLLSAIAKHESGWNPLAKGGGGRFLGLMQISPKTAAANGCDAADAAGLLDGGANLSCAVRIMARNIGRDGAITKGGSGGWLGLARDWMPLRNASARRDIARWTAKQSYCE